MINLESIEIHDDSSNHNNQTDIINIDNMDNIDISDGMDNISNTIISSKKKSIPKTKKTSKKQLFETETDTQSVESDNSNKINIDEINIGYPNVSDPNIQSKIYAKREFYYYKLPDRPDLSNYKEIAEYRKKICEPSGELLEHQAMLSNFINPDTPYKGLLVFHGTGTGKTCVGIAVAEKFKQQVQRYGTQIYILVPGPLLKENWRSSFIQCTGDTYLRTHENLLFLNDEEKEKIKKQAVINAQQYYKVMSYKSFYRKVLGEKIIEKKMVEGKIKSIYKKTDEGEFERDIGMDIIHNLNNTLIIVDEAHNLTGNAYGEALMKIIRNSTNLKLLLLTATPMKNLGDDIVELLNFLRPQDSQIQRDIIFTSAKNHTMELKPGGLEYLKKMASGYISHLRGADPMTFAEKVDMGIKPKGLMFTKISQCEMGKFQLEAYREAKKLAVEEADALDRKSEAVANFVFPGLNSDKTKLVGLYGRDGLTQLKNQLKNHYDKINNLIAKEILGLKKYDEELININEETKNITGAILKKENLKHFSTKFYQAYVDMEKNLFIGGPNSNTESRTGFIYSNLVKTGIEIFQEILNINGFLPYEENKNNYQIKDNTKCYFCGKTHKEHEHKDKNDLSHTFSPATYIVVTGQSSEEGAENIPEESKRIVSTVFSNLTNKAGKNIKLVLGSKVMNEGISLHNVSTVQVLDVYFNFGRLDQVIGRAIRWCSHYNLMSESNPYPKVKVYKYAVSLDNSNNKDSSKYELSTEEDLYYKAEQKYILVKKIERGLKEVAIDCALNQQGNMFKEEIDYYSKCIEPNNKLLDIMMPDKNNKSEPNVCPSKCDFTNCNYKCADPVLNSKYYDPKRNIYRKLSKSQLDLSTFTSNLARTEIDYAKKKIKELYMVGYVYNLKTITSYVEDSYSKAKKDLFDDFFVQKGLDELIPITENDFNNFKDIVYDKTRRAGYLIYLDGYYIFQPFDENENAPMNYRTTYQYDFSSRLSLHNYLINEKYDISTNIGTELDKEMENIGDYDFVDVMDYYDNRKEYDIVGIIDKETNKKKSKRPEDIKDIFKIREKREKILEKKRGTGIPSLKGAVCATSKEKEYLETLAKNVGVKKISKDLTRDNICELIKDKLIELEKYSKGKNKMTYIMVPSNHPTLKFPLNLEDRMEYIKSNTNKILSKNINFKEKIDNKTKSIELSFKLGNKPNNEDIKGLENLGLETKDKLKWSVLID
jgi:superfamily II DNA or RNA helicase